VPLVITHRDDPAETVWFASVAELARARSIETLVPDDPNTPEIAGKIRDLRPDFLFSFYYRLMLKPALLSVPRRGSFNMHGSLLPKYRGRAPVNWAIIHGETETGATLHEMAEKPDAGRIVDQEAVGILPDEIAVDVFGKVAGAAERVLERSLPKLVDGSAVLRAQDLPRAAISAAAGPRTAASTGARRRNGCTTWSARSRRPTPARSPRWKGCGCGCCGREGARRRAARRLPRSSARKAAVAMRCAPTERLWSSSGWNWTDGRSPRKN